MKKQLFRIVVIILPVLLLPALSHAEGVADDLHGLQSVLQQLYGQMMPLCSGMIGVGRAIAGFATLWYIGARVWKHLAAAEPIDIYPLLRPFAIGFCIAAFPLVLALINGVLQPVVTATEGMVQHSNAAIDHLLASDPQHAQEDAANGANTDPDQWYQYSHPDGAAADGSSGNPISDAFSSWSIKNMARKWIAELLNVLFEAAALCLDTIRTFKLIVLSILGPLCFGLSVFDGFQHTLKQWLARYINVFMWLPIANIFGAIIARIQENMITLAQSGELGGNSFGNSNTAYLIFLLIAIIGYFTVPGIANYIVNAGSHPLLARTSALASVALSYFTGSVMTSMKAGSQPAHTGQANHQQHFQQDRLSGGPAGRDTKA